MKKIAFILLALTGAAAMLAPQSANYKLPQSIIDSGGKKVSSANYVVEPKTAIDSQSPLFGETTIFYPGFFFPAAFSLPPAFVRIGEFSLQIVAYNRESGMPLNVSDKINYLPKFKLVISDRIGVDLASITVSFNNKVVINSNNRASFLDSVSPETTQVSTLLYDPAELAAGSYALLIEARDGQDRRLTKNYELTVDTGPAKVEGLSVPSGTFSPTYPPVPGKGVPVAFSVSKDTEVNLVVLNPAGRGPDWNLKMLARAGYNQVEFSGISDISNQPLANGIYVIKVIGEGRELGKTYLVVFDKRKR
ncbi:MAG: hypothetical protein KKC80_08305 [Candidatus Margulisbacteria bacterium]|nr:hypothetical protein [Candidatus Margulisiibacteriota bacterium]